MGLISSPRAEPDFFLPSRDARTEEFTPRRHDEHEGEEPGNLVPTFFLFPS
jgi:hypothetical protein